MASLTLTDRSVPETGTEESIPQALCQFVEAQAQKAGTDGAAAHLENISERVRAGSMNISAGYTTTSSFQFAHL